jgi:uncharacterized spore protein YtfJ
VTKPARAAPGLSPAALTIRRVSNRLTGAKLCYGRPVRSGAHTIIPVASVRVAGGGGFGRGVTTEESGAGHRDGDGGGGGGVISASPVGFIEVGPDGARYQRIDDGSAALRRAGASAALLIIARIALRRGVLGQRRAPALRLPRGLPRGR